MNMQEWLIVTKNYSERSARDVQSRLKRALRFSGEGYVTDKTLKEMETNSEFKTLPVSVKSQMRRAIRLEIEYGQSSK